MKLANTDDAVQGYCSGKSLAQLAAEFSVSESTMRRRLLSRNVQLRGFADAQLVRLLDPATTPDIVDGYLAGKSPNQLADTFGVCRSAILNRLSYAGVLVRGMSEAQRLRAANSTPKQRQQLVAAAHAAVRGRRQPVDERIRRASTRQKRVSHASPAERIVVVAMERAELAVTPQFAIGPYNVDIGIESCSVAVEIEAGYHFRNGFRIQYRERLEYILNQGWDVIIVHTGGRPIRDLAAVIQQILTFNQLARFNKSAIRKYGVINRDGEAATFPGSNFDGLTRVVGF